METVYMILASPVAELIWGVLFYLFIAVLLFVFVRGIYRRIKYGPQPMTNTGKGLMFVLTGPVMWFCFGALSPLGRPIGRLIGRQLKQRS
jgi:hypothetical protein